MASARSLASDSFARLGDVADNVDRLRVPLSASVRSRRQGEFPYYGASGVLDHVDDFIFEGRHVLVGEDGTVQDEDGTALVQLVDGKFWVNNHAHVLRGATDVDTRFVYYALKTIQIRPYLSGSVQAKLTQANLSRILIPFPSSSERERVVGLLGSVDDKIDVNRQIRGTLEEIARSLFQSWFVDYEPVRLTTTPAEDISRLFPSRLGDSQVGPVPEGWQVGALSELMAISRESVDPRDDPSELFDHYSLPAFDAGQVPAIERGADIRSSKLHVADGCVLLNKLNPRFSRVWWPPSAGARRRIASTEFVVALPRDYITRSYLYCLFSSRGFRSILTSLVGGTSGSHQRVNIKDLLNIEVSIPPRPLIERFDVIVAPMFDQQEVLGAECRTLAELRDTLLPKLMSGQLRMHQSGDC